MYKLNYSEGKVCSIQKENSSIPLTEGNTDFQQFLEWNAQQAKPLDLKSTIMCIGSAYTVDDGAYLDWSAEL